MKSLHNLTDQTLLETTLSLVKREREITIEIIEHIHEVERRRLFAARGFSSLFEYCVKSLGYSESAAYRRIQALKALKDLPQIKEKIISAKLSLSVVADAQKFFKAEKITHVSQKQALFEVLSGKSAREAQKELAQRSTQPQRCVADRAKAVAPDFFEFKTLVDQAFLDKLQRLKARFAHQKLSTNEILNQMADARLKASDPAREPRAKTAVKKQSCATTSATASATTSATAKLNPHCHSQTVSAEQQKTATSVLHGVMPSSVAAANLRAAPPNSISPKALQEKTPALETSTSSRSTLVPAKRSPRYIRAAIRREVWRRDSGQCTYVDPVTKRRCESTFALQLDHIEPMALGGMSEASNLRLLCACHNQLHAIKSFGIESMRPYMKS